MTTDEAQSLRKPLPTIDLTCDQGWNFGLEKTLAADPKRKEAHGNIAELYLKMGKRSEAKEHYEQYLALWPNSPKAAEVREILKTLN